jgi:D-amino-acid oxidase
MLMGAGRAGRTHTGRVLVIGAGVTGLTASLCLRRSGFDVVVVAERFAPDIVSVVAGALWEWPPAVCGHHVDEVSLARSKDWCRNSYRIFSDLAARPGMGPDIGVFIRPVVFYFTTPVRDRSADLSKMNELTGEVRDFVHDASLIDQHHVGPRSGVVDAYGHSAPMIDTDIYMDWLLAQVTAAGCTVVRGRISGNLRERETDLRCLFGADCIVNCTGLGAAGLCDDDMYPLRGALIRVHNDGRSMPRVTTAHCVAHDLASTEQDMVFIVPRGEDMLLIGGMTEPDEWGLDIGLDNYAPVGDMMARCQEFLPVLRSAEIDTEDPVRVGLRPFRKGNVRLEIEPGTRIIHNYGHGGSGVTFSWGCAIEAAEMVKQLVLGDAEASVLLEV